MSPPCMETPSVCYPVVAQGRCANPYEWTVVAVFFDLGLATEFAAREKAAAKRGSDYCNHMVDEPKPVITNQEDFSRAPNVDPGVCSRE